MKCLIITILSCISFSLIAQDETFIPFYGNQQECHLNGNSTVYTLPDESSPSRLVQKRLEFLRIISHDTTWYKIRFSEEGTDKIETGYVYRNRISESGIYVAYMKTFHYELNNPQDDHAVLFSVKDYDTQMNTDTLHMYNMYHGFRVMDIGRTHLKGAENLISFQTYRESCPGLTSDDFILVNAEGKMNHFANSTSTGEAGWNEIEELYFPVKFANGNIKLILSGDIKNMIDWQNGEVKEIKNPETYGIPLDELVIKKTYQTEPIFDKEDNELVNEEGEPILSETEGYTVYRWDGKELKEVNMNGE